MPRTVLDEANIHPSIRSRVENYHRTVVDEVKQAIAKHDVVVVGMKQNPYPRKARRALDDAGIEHAYLEYGSYLGGWRPRSALKMWTGWPTFPMVFHKGALVGGAAELLALLDSGQLKK